MHGDVKLENTFVKANTPLLGDFGMAHPFTPGQRFNHIAGTHEYMAPEVWKADYNEDAEMWSLVVALYTLLSGKKPFTGSKLRGAKMLHVS